MKNLYKISWIWCLCIVASYAQSTPKFQFPKGHQLYKQLKIADQKRQVKDTVNPFKTGDRAMDRIYYELDRTCDPMTRKIPDNIHVEEQKFVKNKKSLGFNRTTAKFSGSNWVNRGPYNVGGRTRALAIDMTNENVILAGGVSGGMWRSEDGGKNWRKVTRPFQNPSVTTIAQDPRPGHQHIWYYGGGERIGSSASYNAASLYTGNGIYKSQDGGRTWELLTNTVDNTVNRISPFDLVSKIVVHPATGDVYVATLNGIFRSQDGGDTFLEVLASGQDRITEIIVAPSGRLFASVPVSNFSQEIGAFYGVYFSDNGTDWTNVEEGNDGMAFSELIIKYANRIKIAVNPVNENELYILAHSARGEFRHDGINGNSRISTFGVLRYKLTDDRVSSIENLTGKIPRNTVASVVSGLNLQTGYNMILEIHPQDPNVIYVGGTNLFRTTDAFETFIEEDNYWIGGYSPKNDVSLYPDQHPDMHALVFYPSNPDRVLNANDGGVFRTENIRANTSFEEPVDWTSINNGYLTTQPYAISFDPETDSKELLAGFQDNGTWYTNSTNSTASWIEELGGDGSYNAFADKGRTRYSSSQRGNIVRINYNENGDPVSYARIQPPVNGFSFIAPFVLDPNDDNVMYLPAGRTMLRNSNLDSIPTADINSPIQSLSTINWSTIASVESVPDGDRELNVITAMDVSKFPEPNKLYFGTGQGQIYRMDFANLVSSEPIDIFTDKGLPERGFISSLQVDPNDSDRVVVSFSNYNIKSVFMTEDAGNTWSNISGNLEENADGTGNGPSVRWVTFLGNRDGLLAGTSTGLYYANRPSGSYTVWQKENQEIGDGVVMQARSRKDGFTAVAVHGNGVFSKQFNVKRPSGPSTLSLNKRPEDMEFSVDQTPEGLRIDLGEVFKDERFNNPAVIRLSIENTNTEFIDARLELNRFLNIRFKKRDLDIPEYDKEGVATIRIIGKSGRQKLATEFTIRTFQEAFFTQFDPTKDIIFDVTPSSEIPNAFLTDRREFSEVADHLTIPNGEKWIIQRIIVIGDNSLPSDPAFIIPGNEGILRIYKNDQGKPGELIVEKSNVLRSNPFSGGIYDLVLPTAIELSEGKYWIVWVRGNETRIVLNNIFQGQQVFLSDDPNFDSIGEDIHTRGSVENLNDKPDVWFPYAKTLYSTDNEKTKLVYFLYGEIINGQFIKENNTEQELLKLYPNPITNSLTIDLRDKQSKKERVIDNFVKVTDITGKEIYSTTTRETTFTIDTSDWSSGMYIVSVKDGSNVERTTKIIRL